jgi:hypothetical protein
MFKQPYEKAVKKWNGYEYLEFCEFKTVQRLSIPDSLRAKGVLICSRV